MSGFDKLLPPSNVSSLVLKALTGRPPVFDSAKELRRYKERQAIKKVKKRRKRRAARQHMASDSSTKLNTAPPFPMIDAHCHIFGQSLGGTGTTLDMLTDVISSVKSEARMAYYGMRPDRQNAELIVSETRRFRQSIDDEDAVAVVPLLLDMSYTPLAIPSWVPNALLPGDFKNKKEGDIAVSSDPHRYYMPGEKFLWVGREDEVFQNQVDTFAQVAALYCGEVLAFVPFDPRRPNGLSFVRDAIEKKGMVGVKLYSRCGWMPYENAKMFGTRLGNVLDTRLEGLYDYCTNNDIPVLVHTSPTGFPPEGLLALPKEYHATTRLAGMPPQPVMSKSNKLNGTEIAQKAVRWMANYCHYVQNSTSPYAWEPVLQKYPTLRLDLAHSGGTLGVYGKYKMAPDTPDGKWQHEIEVNPFVLGSQGHTFLDHFRIGVRKMGWDLIDQEVSPPEKLLTKPKQPGTLQTFMEVVVPIVGVAGAVQRGRERRKYQKSEKYKRLTTEFAEESERIFKSGSEWDQWLQAWNAKYPDDWTTRITTMLGNYDNLYTDTAYIAGGSPTDFKRLMDNLFVGAEDSLLESRQTADDGWAKKVCADTGSAMAYKNMLATDWFMTAMDGIGPYEFWNRMAQTVTPKTKLWHLTSTENAIRWLNLNGRFDGEGMKMMENYYDQEWGEKAPMPNWWQALKIHYRSGDYKKLTWQMKSGANVETRPRSGAISRT